MRSPIPVLGLITLLLCPVSAVGQPRHGGSPSLPWYRSQAARRQNDAVLSRLETRISRRRPDVYGRTRSLGLSTRPDRVRTELARRYSTRGNRRERALLPMERPSVSPVARMLDQRNLLQSHSRLGRSPSALLGRLDYLLKEDGHWRGEVSLAESSGPVNPLLRTDTTTNPRSHSSRLTERLEEKADRYYRLGVASFREGRYPRSQEYFKLVRQLENDHPRAFVANVLVSLHGSDLNTAVINLIHAIHRADSLADLRLEWKDFYAEEQAFQRVTDSVNVMAKSGAGTNKTMNLILAYYSFLNGDLITAIAAAKVVEEQATSGAPGKVSANSRPGSRRKDLFSGAAKRFGEFLAAARDQGGAPQGDE